jgi:hypothetical protein
MPSPSQGQVLGPAKTTQSAWVPTALNAGASLAAASRAVGSAQGSAFDISGMSMFKAALRVSASAGSVVVSLQVSQNGTTGWTTVGSFPNRSTVGVVNKEFTVKGAPFARWAWTVSTGNVNFGVEAKTFASRNNVRNY